MRSSSGRNRSAASLTRANAQPADEATGPQASLRLMIVPPGSMMRRASRRARNSPEPATTAAAGRPIVGPVARSAASTRRSIRHSSAAWANATRVVFREAVAVGADHPGQAVSGRLDRGGPAVGRRKIARIGCDLAQREVDVESRGEDLGGQPGGDPSQRQLGRQCADRRSAHARVNQLAGLETLGVASPPRRHAGRGRAESSRSWSSRCRSRDLATPESTGPPGSPAPASSPRRPGAAGAEPRRPSETRRQRPRRRSKSPEGPRAPHRGPRSPPRSWSDNSRTARRSWSPRPGRSRGKAAAAAAIARPSSSGRFQTSNGTVRACPSS